MAIPLNTPLRPGQFYLWNADEAQAPDLLHTYARVMVTGVDARDDGWVCYAVAGAPVRLTACGRGQFCGSVIPDPGEAWMPAEDVQRALDDTQAGISRSPVTGLYPFMAHPLLVAAVKAATALPQEDGHGN